MPYKKYEDLNNSSNIRKTQQNHQQNHQQQQPTPLKNIEDCESITCLEHKNKIIREYKYVVVDVYGDWCGPCKKIYPQILELQNKWPTVKFVKEDIDKKITNVNGVPYFQFYKKGKYVGDSIGASIKNVENKITEMYED